MKSKKILSMLLILVLIMAPINGAFASESFATLRYGSRGNDVSRLQQALKDKGYNISVDGIYGKATENAVINFQKAYGLRIDGIAGKQTQTSLYGNSPISGSILKVGSRGSDVTKLQQALQNKGYYKGAIDGIYGQGTRTAVSNFQRDCGLVVDGIAGKNTFAALNTNTTIASVSRGTSTARANYNQDDLYWLARIIHAEAGAEPYNGKVAVGNVILNRVNSKDFPNTIYDVIFEYYQNIPQFSPVADGTIYNTPSEESMQAARDALNGSRPVGNSTYFFNPDKAAGTWIVKNKAYVTRIGGHTFYQ
jgi:N-acetylmuramoyl-L-alanine amidase